MKLGHEFYHFNYLKRNQKCSFFLNKPQNSGKFAQIGILYSNDRLTPVHEGYNHGLSQLLSVMESLDPCLLY